MQNIVILLNVIVAIGCLWLARWFWKFRATLKRWTQALLLADRVVHDMLQEAPESILSQQMSLHQLNRLLTHLEHQIQQAKLILTLSSKFHWIWRRFKTRLPIPR